MANGGELVSGCALYTCNRLSSTIVVSGELYILVFDSGSGTDLLFHLRGARPISQPFGSGVITTFRARVRT